MGHFTFGAVNLVGSLQIPTFFLLSGFCLSLGEFHTFLLSESELFVANLVANRCFSGYGSPSRTWQTSDFYLSRLSRLYPMFLISNLLGLCGWPGPGSLTPLRYQDIQFANSDMHIIYIHTSLCTYYIHTHTSYLSFFYTVKIFGE